MSTPLVDPVTQFLTTQGMRPEAAYFEKSDFVIGWRVRVHDLELVYRHEGDELIICDLVVADEAQATRGAVATFIKLVHRIERSVRGLRAVRGMFLQTMSDPALNLARKRLATVLEAQGAQWQQIDGDSWLVYPVQAQRGTTRGA